MRTVLGVTAALVAGFFGGYVQSRGCEARDRAYNVVRSSRFELVDESGGLLASLSSGADGTFLSFLGRNGSPRVSVGLGSDRLPYIYLNGPDFKPRLVLQLEGEDAKPVIGMSDADWEGRVLLGFLAGDLPSRVDDDWGLVLRARHSELAHIGMTRDSSGLMFGNFTILDERGKRR